MNYHRATGRHTAEDALRHSTASEPFKIGEFELTPVDGGMHFDVLYESDGTLNEFDIAHRKFAALAFAWVLATGTPYRLDIGRIEKLDGARLTVQLRSRVDAVTSKNVEIGTTEIDAVLEFNADLATRLEDETIRLILSDIECAARDRTKFALIHLFRALETIRNALGVTGDDPWRQVESRLDLPPNFLDVVTKRRSQGKYGIAHAPSAEAKTTEVPYSEVQLADEHTVTAFRAFLRKANVERQ